jgi:hypothetical protein
MTIGTQQAKILEQVIRTIAVDVIQLQGDVAIHPLAAITIGTTRLQHALADEPLAQMGGVAATSLDQQLVKWGLGNERVASPLQMPAARPM